MAGLAWYVVIFSALFIIGLILNIAGVIARPPFSAFENIAIVIALVPVLILAILVIRRVS